MTLLNYARAPLGTPTPLPGLNRRNADRWGSTDWPVALLAEPLSADLIATGISADERGKLADADGRPLAAVTVAERAADILDEASALLELAADTAGVCRVPSRRTGPLSEAERLIEESSGLRRSAVTLRTSQPAVRNLILRLVPRLPAPAGPRVALEEFLARYDAVDLVKRSDLGRDYVADGSPGGLTRLALYQEAERRFGPVVMLDGGARCYRPQARETAAAARSAAEPPVPPGGTLADALAALNARFGLDAVATAQDALAGYHDRVRDLLQRGNRLRALTLHREHHSR